MSISADQMWEEVSDQQLMMMIRSDQMISADHCGKRHGRDADQQIICAADNPIARVRIFFGKGEKALKEEIWCILDYILQGKGKLLRLN